MIPLGKLKGPFHTVDRYWEENVIMNQSMRSQCLKLIHLKRVLFHFKRVLFKKVQKWRYRDRKGGIKSIDVQPSKLNRRTV